MVCGNRGLAALADDTALVRLAHPTHAKKTSASTQVCSSLRVFTVCQPNAMAFSGGAQGPSVLQPLVGQPHGTSDLGRPALLIWVCHFRRQQEKTLLHSGSDSQSLALGLDEMRTMQRSFSATVALHVSLEGAGRRLHCSRGAIRTRRVTEHL